MRPAAAADARRRLPAAVRRAQIVRTAQALYRASGRDSVSMEGIADAAGINIALLYRHFRSSAEVYHASVLEPLHELLDAAVCRDRVGWPSESRERLVAVHVAVLSLLREAGPLLGLALFSDGETGARFYRERIIPLIDGWIEPMVREVVAAGRLKQDPHEIAVELFGIDLTCVMSPEGPPESLDIGRIAHRLVELQWPGLKGGRRVTAPSRTAKLPNSVG
jgi:AcrR family transcriptional regulator